MNMFIVLIPCILALGVALVLAPLFIRRRGYESLEPSGSRQRRRQVLVVVLIIVSSLSLFLIGYWLRHSNKPFALTPMDTSRNNRNVHFIFAYGTLRDDDNSGAPWTKPWIQGVIGQDAFVRGVRLFQEEGVTWPYVVLSPSQRDVVHGRLLHWKDGDTFAARLRASDEIEEYEPGNSFSLYQRTVIKVYLSTKNGSTGHTGSPQKAWMYYQRRITPHSSLVPGGDWMLRHWPWPNAVNNT